MVFPILVLMFGVCVWVAEFQQKQQSPWCDDPPAAHVHGRLIRTTHKSPVKSTGRSVGICGNILRCLFSYTDRRFIARASSLSDGSPQNQTTTTMTVTSRFWMLNAPEDRIEEESDGETYRAFSQCTSALYHMMWSTSSSSSS